MVHKRGRGYFAEDMDHRCPGDMEALAGDMVKASACPGAAFALQNPPAPPPRREDRMGILAPPQPPSSAEWLLAHETPPSVTYQITLCGVWRQSAVAVLTDNDVQR